MISFHPRYNPEKKADEGAKIQTQAWILSALTWVFEKSKGFKNTGFVGVVWHGDSSSLWGPRLAGVRPLGQAECQDARYSLWADMKVRLVSSQLFPSCKLELVGKSWLFFIVPSRLPVLTLEPLYSDICQSWRRFFSPTSFVCTAMIDFFFPFYITKTCGK